MQRKSLAEAVNRYEKQKKENDSEKYLDSFGLQ